MALPLIPAAHCYAGDSLTLGVHTDESAWKMVFKFAGKVGDGFKQVIRLPAQEKRA